MVVDDIRRSFSKASVVFSQNQITIIYTKKGMEIIQTMSEIRNSAPGVQVFADLIRRCKRFVIRIKIDHEISFGFVIDGISSETVYYPPLDFGMSAEEMEEMTNRILEDSVRSGAAQRFLEFFSGVDIQDSKAFADRMDQILPVILEEKINHEPIHLAWVKNWDKLKAAYQKLIDSGFSCFSEIDPPHKGNAYSGYIDMHIDSVCRDHPLILDGKQKDTFEDLIRSAMEIGITIDVEDGVLSIEVS